MRRVEVLPAQGRLMVSTDLHGNQEDWQVLQTRFEAGLAAGEDLHWALLGDLVHGPSPAARLKYPALYGYEDRSPQLIDALFELRAKWPERVHVVLGNHEAGHLGAQHTAKFYEDEVEALEQRLTPGQRARAQVLFSEARLMLAAPCGLLLSHGSPGDEVTSLALLDCPYPPPPASWAAVDEVLWSYGQLREVSQGLLARASAELGLSLRVVVHGHDRDEKGWFVEGGNQVQAVIFGAVRETKRYLVVDLGGRYESPEALREGHEVLRLYPPG